MTQQQSSSVTGELLPCPLCQCSGDRLMRGICFPEGSIDKEGAVGCPDCGCRATLKAWQSRIPAQLMQWQPIETAPKRSRHALYFGDGEGFMQCIIVGSWNYEKERWETAFGGRNAYGLTHWMQLPEGPAFPSTERAAPNDDIAPKSFCIFCGKPVLVTCKSRAMAADCEHSPPPESPHGR